MAEVNINPRYLKYGTKQEVEELLEKVENSSTAAETAVREIVTSYEPQNEEE